MKPTEKDLKSELITRVKLLDEIIEKTENKFNTLFENEKSNYLEIIELINLFGNRLGHKEFEVSKYTPIKCAETKEPLKIGDKVKSWSSESNGILHFDDYLNQYVIKTEFNTHHKCSSFIKIKENFDYSIDNSRVECRPNPNKKKW